MTKEALREGPLVGGVFDYEAGVGPDQRFPVEATTSNSSEGQIALQIMRVQLPDEPLKINGVPFSIRVNEPRLAGAINKMRLDSMGRGRFDTQLVAVSLGESLPKRLAEPEPQHKAHGQFYDYRDGSIRIEAPREITKTSLSISTLVEKLETALNEDLEDGIDQNCAVKQYFLVRRYLNLGAATLMGGIGEGAAIVISNGSVGELILRGSAGATLGTAAVGAVVFLKRRRDRRLHGDSLAPIEARAFRAERKRKQQDGAKERDGYTHIYFKDQPIISLIPANEADSRTS